eukprot:PhF_6_TR12923/c0_g1_i1/m.20388
MSKTILFLITSHLVCWAQSPIFPNIIAHDSTIFLNESVTMDITSAVVGDAHVTIRCDSLNTIVRCPQELPRIPCFSVSGSQASLTLHGCVILGLAVEYNTELGDLTLDGCVLDGEWGPTPVNVERANRVTIRNTTVMRGADSAFFQGGGCISLRHVRDSVSIVNSSILNCSSRRNGGCVHVAGCVIQSVSDMCDPYGGNVTVTSSTFECCRTEASPGGLLSVRFMSSVVLNNNIFRHGTAHMSEGCVEIFAISPGIINLQSNTAYNCTSETSCNGCVGISSQDKNSSLSPITIADLTAHHCQAQCVAGVGISNSRAVDMKRVTVSDCVAENTTGGCLVVNDVAAGVVATDTRLYNCVAVTTGGGMSIFNTKFIELNRFTVFNAYGTMGGGLYAEDSNVSIRDSVMWNASASEGPCFMIHGNATLTLTNVKLQCIPTQRSTHPVRYHVNGKTTMSGRRTESFLRPLTTTPSLWVTEANKRQPANNRNRNMISKPVMVASGESVGYVTTGGVLQAGALYGHNSGSSALTTSWLLALTYKCNDYKLNFVESSLTPLNYEDNPRTINLYFNGVVLVSVWVFDAVGTFLWLKCTTNSGTRWHYRDVTHPSVSLRAYVFFAVDVTAASVCCVMARGGAVNSTLGVVGLLVSVAWVVVSWWSIRKASSLHTACYHTLHFKRNTTAGKHVPFWLLNQGTWLDTETSDGMVRKVGVVFEEFIPSRVWMGLLNVVVSVVQGVLSGITFNGEDVSTPCSVMYWCTVGLYVSVLTVTLRYPAHHTRRDRIGFTSVLLTLIMGNTLRAVDVTFPSLGGERSTLYFAILLCIGCGFAVNGFLVLAYVFAWRWESQHDQENGTTVETPIMDVELL